MVHGHFTQRLWVFLIGCLLLCPVLLQAQGWQRFHGGLSNDRAFAVKLLPDGGIVATGSTTDSVAGTTDWYFLKADSLGHLLEESSWGDTLYNESAVAILPAANGGWFVSGSKTLAGSLSTAPLITLSRIDAVGNLNATWSYPLSTLYNSVPWGGDHLFLGAKYYPDSMDAFIPRFLCQKTDTSGNIIWEKDLQFGQYGRAESALLLQDGNAVVAGSFFDFPNLDDIVVVKVNAAGDSIKSQTISLPGGQRPSELHLGNAGQILLVGTDGTNSVDKRDLFLIALSPELDTLWSKVIEVPGLQLANASLVLPNGNIAIIGEHIPEGSSSRDGFLALSDSMGKLLWFKTYGGFKGDIFWDLQAAPDGNGFIIAGQTASFSSAGDLQAWLLRTDSLGNVWNNRVIGRVTRDAVENCIEDAGEPSLAGWLVTASGVPGTLYTLTDSSGAYSINVDTGAWFVSVLPPAAYWSPCEDSLQVYALQFGDTIAVDFSVQAVYDCPLLDVDLSTPYMRRCYENTYYVRYFNYGTAAAPNALIFIVLDPFLTATGSNLPYTQSGDTLFFSVGQVESLEGGNFYLTATLDCDSTVLGQTHCTEAHIFPDSLCYDINPEWDGAHLEVDGICMGDSVLLTVTNTGLGMQSSVNYIIVEDQIMFKLSTLQLAAGQDTSFVLYPGGSTVTIIVNQTHGHPGSNQPTLVIEGCGGFPFSTGYALQFPQNDGDFSTDIECRQNIGSFDPNDKTGLPEGVGEQHVIAPETSIEYLIRFQNTGTDTAFRVEIRDTLPLSLDLATFQQGASSHPYQLKITDFGTISFLFDPIALPDSGANWAASQGFVKFRITPKIGTALGTIIENRASIYFDQNTPVVTNQTLHTLGEPFQYLITPVTEPMNTNTAVGALLIAPNPTFGNTLIHLAQPLKSEGLRLRLLDALGREVESLGYWDISKNPHLDLSNLAAGVYFLELKNSEGIMIARGKVMKI